MSNLCKFNSTLECVVLILSVNNAGISSTFCAHIDKAMQKMAKLALCTKHGI